MPPPFPSRRRRLHLADSKGLTWCGRVAGNLDVAETPTQVTCRVCANRASIRLVPRRTDPETISGTGKLKCRNCGLPYRDHELAQLCMKEPVR